MLDLEQMYKLHKADEIGNQINRANLFAEKLLVEHMKRDVPMNEITHRDVKDAREIANMLYPIIIPEE